MIKSRNYHIGKISNSNNHMFSDWFSAALQTCRKFGRYIFKKMAKRYVDRPN